jgi:hypothetical protein
LSYSVKSYDIKGEIIEGTVGEGKTVTISGDNLKLGTFNLKKDSSLIFDNVKNISENKLVINGYEIGDSVIIKNSDISNFKKEGTTLYDNNIIDSITIIDSKVMKSDIAIFGKKIILKNNEFSDSNVIISPASFISILVDGNTFDGNSDFAVGNGYYNFANVSSGTIMISANIFNGNFRSITKNKINMELLNNNLNIVSISNLNYDITDKYKAVYSIKNNIFTGKETDDYSGALCSLSIGNSTFDNNTLINSIQNLEKTLKIQGDNNIIKNNKILGKYYCFLSSGNNNLFENNVISGECSIGMDVTGDNNKFINNNVALTGGKTPFYIHEAEKNTIDKNIFNCGEKNNNNKSEYYGIEIGNKVKNNILKNNVVDNCTYGMSTNGFIGKYNTENCIIGNEITGNKFYSNFNRFLGCFYENKIYNNYFESITDSQLYLNLSCGSYNCINQWNIEPTVGKNIAGGSKIGGNYWKWDDCPPYMSYCQCNDSNGDGFCDSPYKVSDNNEYNIDKYPLFYANFIISQGPFNPVNSPWTSKKKPMKVMHLKFKNQVNSKSDAVIESMKFFFVNSGEIGDTNVNDIEEVTLYKDKNCVFEDDSLLKISSGNFSKAQITFSGINETVKSGEECCFILEYKLKNQVISSYFSKVAKSDYSPCNIYGAFIDANNFKVKVNGEDKKVSGQVEGSINASYPSIEFVNSNDMNLIGSKNTKLLKPLQVKLDNFVKSTCYKNWQAVYEIVKEPKGVSSDFLEAVGKKGKKIITSFDGNGISECYFTVGDKSGIYIVSVSIEPTKNNPYTCPKFTSVEGVMFNIFTSGIRLKSDIDGSAGGSSDNIISKFIKTIDAKNKLTAIFDLPPISSKPKSVTFSPSWTASVTDSTEPFEAEFNMKNVGENANLKLVGKLKDGTLLVENYKFSAIQLPEWIATFNGFPYNGITWKFNGEGEKYDFTFSFPDDFAWSNPIPEDIGVIGGEEDEETLNCSVEASYYVNESSSLTGNAEFKGEILGKEVEAKGVIKVYFDKEFKVKDNPPPAGNAEANVDFELGSKTLASKTIIVYGVPVTVQVDVGGNVKIFASGTLIFHKTLKLKKVTFVPGLTITVTIDSSASAAFGFAKIGAKAEPEGTVKIQISYTTDDGKVTQDKFGGEFKVPVTVYGSLFWDTINGDLGSTEFGPWSFGDSISDSSVSKSSYYTTELKYIQSRLHKIKKSALDKKFYSTSDTDIDNSGKILIYTKDISLNDTEINPEIAVKLNGNEQIITNNNLWEIDPCITYTENGRAIALWTSNDGDKSLKKLNEIFSHQDIAYSYYNGNSWSKEALIINDNVADGMANVAYGGNNMSMAVWVHNTSSNEKDIQDKTKYELMYSVFNENNKTWSTPAVIPGTNSGSCDFMPRVTGINNGKFAVVWIKDSDGKLFTKLDKIKKGSDVDDNNTDCNVYYTEFDGTNWTASVSITDSNMQTEIMPDIAVNSNGDIAVVWVEKNQGVDRLFISEKNSVNNSWSSASLLDQGSYLIESPNISIDGSNIAHVIYRKVSGSDEGLYETEKSLSSITSSSTKVSKLTISKGSLFVKAEKDKNGNVIMSWTNVNASDTLELGEIDSSDNSILAKSGYITEKFDNSTGKYKGIKLTVPANIDKSGKFKVSAKLFKGDKFISSGQSNTKELTSGEKTFEILFSGRDISGAQLNGPFSIKEITLEKYTPSPCVKDIAQVNVNTEIYYFNEFIPPVLLIDKNIYKGTNANMFITVYDDNDTSPEVFVSSSSENSGKIVSLSGDNGSYTGKLSLSELNVKEGSVITVFYIDSKAKQWKTSAMWIETPPEMFELNVNIDNYTGENKVTGLEGGVHCPDNCYESVKKGTNVTLIAITDSNSKFVGWNIKGCDNSSIECTFTMDNDTEVKAVFKKKEAEFTEETSGDVTETGITIKRIMNLSKGWNLVSIPVDKTINTGDKFAGATTVWGWTGSNWEVWSPLTSIITLLNQYKIIILSDMKSGKGYWINTSSELSENFEGTTYGKDKITIENGWNLFGLGVKISVTEFNNVKTLWKWIGSSWKVWSPQSAIAELLNQYKIETANEVKAGEGFWVNK